MCFQDYLGNMPIRCFYKVIFYKDSMDVDNRVSGVSYLDGDSRFFKIGDRLPLISSYFKYPNDMLIYDYKGNDEIIHIIKDGVYMGNKAISELPNELLKESHIISSDGREILNIKNKNDIKKLKDDWILFSEEYNALTKEFFPRGKAIMYMSDKFEYNKIKPKFELKYKEISHRFKDKWIKKDKYLEEKHYGALLEALKNSYWELKYNNEISHKEKIFRLSLIYEEIEIFLNLKCDIEDRYLSHFKNVSLNYINNIKSMAESFIGI